MEFLKNHYEKILLSAVLLGLAVAIAILPMRVPSAGEDGGTNAPPTKFRPVDNRTNEVALANLEGLQPVVFSGVHNLFSPVEWRRTNKDGPLWKIDREGLVGLGALMVKKITPRFLILSYDGYNAPKFQIGVLQQSKNPDAKNPTPVFAALNEKKEFFTVLATKGPPDNPTELSLELHDGKKTTLAKDKPYQEVMDYTADLVYPHDNVPPFFRQKVGDKLRFDGDTNIVVEINSNEVVVSASSGKRKTIKAAP